MDGLTLEKEVFHSTKALSPDGIEIIEIETPPNKTDLVRLNDSYGRECHGYEGSSEMETEDLRRFNHFYFEEPLIRGEKSHFGETYSLLIETFFDDEHFQNSFHINPREIYSLCRGQILNSQSQILFDTGDAFSGDLLKGETSLKIKDKIVLLTARQKDRIASN